MSSNNGLCALNHLPHLLLPFFRFSRLAQLTRARHSKQTLGVASPARLRPIAQHLSAVKELIMPCARRLSVYEAKRLLVA